MCRHFQVNRTKVSAKELRNIHFCHDIGMTYRDVAVKVQRSVSTIHRVIKTGLKQADDERRQRQRQQLRGAMLELRKRNPGKITIGSCMLSKVTGISRRTIVRALKGMKRQKRAVPQKMPNTYSLRNDYCLTLSQRLQKW